MSKQVNKNISNIFLFLAVLSILSFYLTQYFYTRNHSSNSEAQYLSEHIDTQAVKLFEKKKITEQILSNNPDNYWNKLDSLFNRDKYICFVDNQDSISYWNTNKVDAEAIYLLTNDNHIHVINLKSGWYLYTTGRVSNLNVSILELIKSDYLLHNDLLTPKFSSNYANSFNMNLTLDKNASLHKIYNSSGEFILGTNYTTAQPSQTNSNYLAFVLFLISYIFLIIAILQKIINSKLIRTNPYESFIIFILAIISLRIIDILTIFPTSLKTSPIFKSSIFNIPTAASEGDRSK